MNSELGTGDKVTEAALDLFDDIFPLSRPAREKRLAQLDPALARQVTALLAGADGTGILDQAPLPVSDGIEAPATLPAGTQIGGFVIDRFVGRGGMGEVYHARRDTVGFDQWVALKLLRVDSIPNAALFHRERRLLARLQHPNIAQLVDGGIGPDGRPWMAMRYIDGTPIDVWCRETSPTLRQRLDVFREIGGAVAYAHANLLVHRDLKPSNILVDRDGHAQLLDFGIAKLLEDDLPGTLATASLMTPDYAAPEQLEAAPATVATDVYALGVVLYEMLTGTTPWRRGGGTVATMIRRILHEDPVPPSRADAPQIPAARLRGDLDAVVLKALRRAPADRYPSVQAMIDDLGRFERGLPVRARIGSRRYRIGRFLTRNKWPIAAAAAILLALIGGGIGIALQARRAEIQRDAALAEARRSDSIVQTLTLMFGQAGRSSDATVKQTLDQSAQHMLSTLDSSERSGAVVSGLSDLYVNMQDAKGSYDLIKQALARGIGKDSPTATAQMKADLADAAVALGTDDDVPGLLAQAQGVFDRDAQRYAVPLQQIVLTRAAIARRAGDYDKAISLLKDNLDKSDAALAENSSALLTLYNNLLIYMIESNRLDQMGPIFKRTEQILARSGQKETVQGIGIDQVRSGWLMRTGDVAGAERVELGVVDRRRRLFGESAGLASDLGQLGKIQLAKGDPAAAERSLRAARPMAVKYLGPNAFPVIMMDITMAQALAARGAIPDAKATLQTARASASHLPPGNPVAPQIALAQAVVATKAGDKAGARAAVAEARAGFTAMGPSGAAGLVGVDKVAHAIAAMP